MDNFAEKRDFQRMAIECVTSYQSLNSDVSGEGSVKNLSAKGFLLEAEDEFSPKTEIIVKLTPVNSITPPMSAKASVIRSVPVEGSVPLKFEVACEILEILHNEEDE